MVSAGRVLICAAVGDAGAPEAVGAAVAVAATLRMLEAPNGSAEEGEPALLLDLRRAPRSPRGTLLASASARALEATARERMELRAAARGRICVAAQPWSDDAEARGEALAEILSPAPPTPLVVVICETPDFRRLLAVAGADAGSALVRALPGADRSLIALLAAELREEGIPFRAWTVPIGAIQARRALAGLEPGGESGRRATRFAAVLAPERGRSRTAPLASLLRAERAQALPAVLAIAVLIVGLALALVAVGGAATAKGQLQRSADLAALSAARSMRDDFARLFVPARRADGRLDPDHLERVDYLARARSAAAIAAERNGTDAELLAVRFPDGRSMAPLRVRVVLRARFEAGDGSGDGGARAIGSTSVRAEAEVSPPTAAAAASTRPATATGGGYGGPLAYRGGKPMRPDVAAAFDRMAAAARSAGITLVVNSGFRSDAEQQRLWEQNPDPRWVAPPGTSLHRCGTELDLGPPAAYGWLAANASRFDFVKRYSWEAWHFGYDGGPPPCSAEGERVVSRGEADGRRAAGGGLPSFVPERFRPPLLASAARHDVSAALLAAQLMAESNFNPNAVSAAGAQGIAQFMPATAAAYGLRDPFDPVASIDAQARMMGELVARFDSVELALAAYNAGPGAVGSCNCIPPYPETQAYVAKIMGLLAGAGDLVAPPAALEVRLVA